MVQLMKDILQVTGICPILASAEEGMAVPAAKALALGGLPVVEVLLRGENSLANLEQIAKNAPETIAGAGTVTSVAQAEQAIGRGAQFIVMPGFGRTVVEYCLKRNVPVIPGCVTPAEITAALEYGIETVKFFPVYQLGGLAMLDQLSGPFPAVRYLVTGALDENNFLPLLRNRSVLACGGDWMFTQGGALARRDYGLIAKNLRASICRAQDLRNQMALQK
jgi:2-dehydro-3-deoxyphosphogluconate aldolase/(4S)-4-hydroxy-2-oxoglutarate aldolase